MSGAALNNLLVHGTREGTLATLAESWQAVDLRIRLPGMAGFAASPSLGNKVRGAIGTVLLRSASAAVHSRRLCDWSNACNSEVFFGSRPLLVLGSHASEISKPYVLLAEGERNGTLTVTMRLFGFATSRAQSVAEACVTAVRECVRWREMVRDGERFLPRAVDISDVQIVPRKPEATACPSDVFLTFRTPLDAERADPAESPERLLVRLVRRLSLLAPWHGVSLKEVFPELLEAAQTASVEVIEECSAAASTIGGHKFRNKLSAPCWYAITSLPPVLWPAIVLGVQTHVGRGATLGLGRYVISDRP